MKSRDTLVAGPEVGVQIKAAFSQWACLETVEAVVFHRKLKVRQQKEGEKSIKAGYGKWFFNESQWERRKRVKDGSIIEGSASPVEMLIG